MWSLPNNAKRIGKILKNKYGESLKKKGVNIADVESESFSKLNYKADIHGFPTVRIYHNGEAREDLKGERTTDNMYNFIKKYSEVQRGGGKTRKRRRGKRRISLRKRKKV